MITLEQTTTPNIKTLGFILFALVLGIIGGYLTGTYNQQPTINELKQNNTALITELANIETQYNILQNNLTEKEQELADAKIEIRSLEEELDIYTHEVEQLQNEIDTVTISYQNLEKEYQNLLENYENLTIQSRYKINEIFTREDFTISYNIPERLYISPTFTIEGETTKFDLTLWCEKVRINPSAQFRIYKAETPIRVYTNSINLKEDPELEIYYAERSLSVVLDAGNYYIIIVVDDGVLSPSPNYQTNIHVWDYY